MSWGSGNYFFLNGSKFKSENIVTEETTPFLPDLYLNGGINIKTGSFNLNLSGYYRGERSLPNDLTINRERASSSSFISNLAVTRKMADGIDFYILIENVFNSENFIPLSQDGLFVPLRGRILNLGVNLKF